MPPDEVSVPADGTSARQTARGQWTANPAGVVYADAEEGTPEFYEQMTRTRYGLQPWHPDLLKTFAPTGYLLEIGCGAGTDHFELAQMADKTMGIDLSDHGAWLTRRRLEQAGLPGTAMVADAEDMPFPDQTFDAVYSFGVIHHTDHPEAVAASMRRVMKPDARFLVALYYRYSFFALGKAAKYILRGRWRAISWRQFLAGVEYGVDPDAPPLVRLYSRRSARALFKDFEDVHTSTVHPVFEGRSFDGRWWAKPFGWYVVVSGRRGA